MPVETIKLPETRIDIINLIIKKNRYTQYLEIGCEIDICFNAVMAENKTGVDPEHGGTHRMTSDEFFENNDKQFDIIFIDGLHTADQVRKDIENSMLFLAEGGVIICHDMNPDSKDIQEVPQKITAWSGDVWKEWVRLRNTREDLDMMVINIDYGVGIIQKGHQQLLAIDCELTYENLEMHRKEWLNLININDFIKNLKYEQ